VSCSSEERDVRLVMFFSRNEPNAWLQSVKLQMLHTFTVNYYSTNEFRA